MNTNILIDWKVYKHIRHFYHVSFSYSLISDNDLNPVILNTDSTSPHILGRVVCEDNGMDVR